MMTKGQQNACRLLEFFGLVPTPPTNFVLRSYSIAAEPCLAAISVLGFQSCRASQAAASWVRYTPKSQRDGIYSSSDNVLTHTLAFA